MFIETEVTPNPETLKFLPSESVMESGTANFATQEDATSSPLAMRLYEIEGVTSVFFGRDFITVTKSDEHDWSLLKTPILGVVMKHFATGTPLFTDDSAISVHADSGQDDELVTKIKELLETRIRPAVAQDGGDILFHGFQRGVVYLRMQGSCSGCPSSTATLKVGIENLLRHHIPEVFEVRAV